MAEEIKAHITGVVIQVTAKVGDTVAIVETRPQSRRKRWSLTRVVRKALEV